MTKSSHRRRTRGDRARSLGAAKRFLDAGDYARAIEPLSEAVRLAPNDARLLNNLGLACMFARRLPEAVMYLRRSIAADPSAGATHHNLGLALQDMGDDEAAIATYRDAVALSPDEAEEELRQVIASDPSAARAHLILGRVLKDVGRARPQRDSRIRYRGGRHAERNPEPAVVDAPSTQEAQRLHESSARRERDRSLGPCDRGTDVAGPHDGQGVT